MNCSTCNGDGYVVSCPDDICRGQGFCGHGARDPVCPECLGDPLYDDEPDDHDDTDTDFDGEELRDE